MKVAYKKQSDNLQVKSPHSCKTNRLMLYVGVILKPTKRETSETPTQMDVESEKMEQ